MREVELKLIPEGPLDVAAVAAGLGTVEDRGSKTLTATYFDTEDLRLARWGATLRYRTGEGSRGKWTLKLPGDDGDTTERDEIDLPGGPGKVPPRALTLTRAFVRSATLGPVVKLRTRRRTWAMLDGSEEVAELVDDEVAVLNGRAIAGRFREIEVEARAATKRRLKEIAHALQEGGARTEGALPKAVRALGPRALEPPDIPAPADAGPRDPAALAVRSAIANAVRRIVHAHAPVVLGDAEGVHRMRVGTRRLRSDLRTFRPLIDAEWAAWVTPELRWLGDALGAVRDVDVLIGRLRQESSASDDLGPLFERLDEERDRSRAELLEALDSGRYVALLVDLVARAGDPPVTPGADRSCAKVLPPLVEEAWEPLAKAGRLLDPSDPDEEWHAVRIKAKRARYAAEAVAPSLGSESKDAGRFARCCEAVQETLGEHQDAVVARDRVTALAKEIEASPAFHFAAGRLAEREERAARAAREAFPKVWDQLDRKKLRRWLTA